MTSASAQRDLAAFVDAARDLDRRLHAVQSELLLGATTRDEFHEQVGGILWGALHDLGLADHGACTAARTGDDAGRSRALNEIHPRARLKTVGQI